MIKKKIYVRKFSRILGIQDKRIIEYCICEDKFANGIMYGISVSESSKNKKLEDTVRFISPNYYIIFNIAKLLYENSVEILGFKDVLKEVLCMLNRRK